MKLMKAIRTLWDQKAKDGACTDAAAFVQAQVEDHARSRENRIASMANAGTLSGEEKRRHRAVIRFLENTGKMLRLEKPEGAEAVFAMIKAAFDAQVAEMKEENGRIQARLHNLFAFSEVAFMDGNEVLVLVTELTVNACSARFIGLYGSEDYQRHNEDLMLHERQDDIMREIEALEL